MSIEDFRALYERHVGYVVSGDMKSAIADMVAENLPTVFDGVVVPRGAVDGHEIKDVRAEGDLRIGETVYNTPKGVIGLRSIWELHDGSWKAARLENFDAAGESK